MKKLTILFVAVALLGLTGGLMAANNHIVNITVNAINQISVTGTVDLVIGTATAGSEPEVDTDNSAILAWTTNGSGKTIGVSANTDPALDGVTLSVTKDAWSSGSGNPAFNTVVLTNVSQTLVPTAQKMTYNGTLLYTADVPASVEDGTPLQFTVT